MNRFPRRTTADRMAEANYFRSLTEQAAAVAVPTVPLKHCAFDKARHSLRLASEFFSGGFPREFFVNSHHTGKDVRFVVVGPEDVLFNQDQWDGEMQVYRPVGHVPNVDHMIVYHQW